MKRNLSGKRIISMLLVFVMMWTLIPQKTAKAAVNMLEPVDGIIYPGDVNADGEVNAKDVTTLRRYLASGWEISICLENCDVNDDGDVNAKDVTTLRRFLAGGWGVTLPEKHRVEPVVTPAVSPTPATGPGITFEPTATPSVTSGPSITFTPTPEPTDEPSDGHVYGEPEYIWSDDYRTCTATVRCTEEGCTQVVTETSTATVYGFMVGGSEIMENTYTVVFKNPLFSTQVHKENVAFCNHVWGTREYTWKDDFSGCTATVKCTKEGCGKVVTEYATATVGEYVIAYNGRKVTTHTATFNNSLFNTQVYEEECKHVWGSPQYIWDSDYSHCTAMCICEICSCSGPTETVNSTWTITTSPSEEDEGVITYTAVFEYSDFETQSIAVNMAEIQGVAIDENNFPDEVFRNYVLSSADTNGNGFLTYDEIEYRDFIFVDDCGISNLKGIEFFINLTSLSCSGNNIETLDLSKNTELKSLTCSYNKLKHLDLSNNTKLTWLACYNNELTILDLSKNTLLTEIYCSSNKLQTLDFSNNTELSWLQCYDNELSELNISNNTKLTCVWCGHNQLSNIDLSNSSELTDLNCSMNNLTSLDISNNTKLIALSCSDNYVLTELSVASNNMIENLSCDWNQLKTFDVSNLSNLKSLSCGHNCLSELDLRNNQNLTDICCNGNQIKLLDLSKNPKVDPAKVFVDEDVDIIWYVYGKATYVWSDDNKECTANVSFVRDGQYDTISETVESETEYEESVCETEIIYVANFSNPLFRTQHKAGDVIPGAGHDYDAWETIEWPTYESKGIERRYCKNCSCYEEREIDVLVVSQDFINDISKEYYYKQLSEYEKQIYIMIKNSDKSSGNFVLDFDSDADIEKINNSVGRALSALFADYPEEKYYWRSNGFGISIDNDKIMLELSNSEVTDYEIRNAGIITDRIIEAMPKGTDAYTTIRNLATYIESYTAYHAWGGSSGPQSRLAFLCDHTALGVFLYKQSVCEGYADAGKILFDKLGIPCLVVGNAAHAWNYVMLEDGKWYAIDLSIAGNFSIFDPELRDGFVTSNTFLVGIHGANYYNSAPYNVSELYLSCSSDYYFPVLSDEDYVYHGTYSFDIPEVEDIEDDAEGTFVYKVNDDETTCTITEYRGKQSGDLIIPEILDGYTVTEIGDGAFYSCKGFTGDLVIPDTVEAIGTGAFEDCINLQGSLSLSKNLKTIGRTAFIGCTGLKGELNLPSGVEQIGECAFYLCRGLTGDIVIPEKVKELHNCVFFGCVGLEKCYISAGVEEWDANNTLTAGINEFIVDENNQYLASVDGVLYDKALTKLITCPTNWAGYLDIPDSVTEICEQACFDCKKITGISLPSELKTIKDRAFEGCGGSAGLGSLILPNKLESIGWRAFLTCNGDGDIGFVGDLIIPDSVTSIGESAFSGNSFGGILTISKNITEINDFTFAYNKFSGDLVIPDGVTRIGVHAFDSQSNDSPTFKDGGQLTLPEGLETIGNGAFMGAGLAGDLIIPDSVTYIGGSAFSGNDFGGCLKLSESLTVIKSDTFLGSKFTGDLIIPDSVKIIENEAFRSTVEDKPTFIDGGKLILPEGIEEIGMCAFMYSGLTGMVDVTNIDLGADAFAGTNIELIGQ